MGSLIGFPATVLTGMVRIASVAAGWSGKGVVLCTSCNLSKGFPGGAVVENSPANAGDMDSVPSLGQEDPLEKGMATHSSILAWRNPMDSGAWQAIVHGVAKSKTQLSD